MNVTKYIRQYYGVNPFNQKFPLPFYDAVGKKKEDFFLELEPQTIADRSNSVKYRC